MRETPTGSLHLRVVKAPGGRPQPSEPTNCVIPDPGHCRPRPWGPETPPVDHPARRGSCVSDDPSAYRCGGDQPTTPSLQATNSEARNHDAENKKQNWLRKEAVFDKPPELRVAVGDLEQAFAVARSGSNPSATDTRNS